MNGTGSRKSPESQLEQLRKGLEAIPLPLTVPHTLAENALKMAILLAEFVEPISELETSYLELKATFFHLYTEDGIKPTPAKNRLEFNTDVTKLGTSLDKWRSYVKAKENVIFRIEKYLESKIKLESRQI